MDKADISINYRHGLTDQDSGVFEGVAVVWMLTLILLKISTTVIQMLMNPKKLVQTASDQELINNLIRCSGYRDCGYRRMCLSAKI